jgi:hypothetical protein
LVVAGCFAALVYMNWPRDRHLIGEPLSVTQAELCAAASADELATPFVRLPVPRQLDTGVHLQRLAYAVKYISCDYVAIPVADKWILAEVPAGFKGDQLTGYLAPWTGGVQAEALRLIRDKLDPESLDKLLPFQLEAGHDVQAESRLMLTVGMAMVGIGLLWAAVGSRRRSAARRQLAGDPQYSRGASWQTRRMPAR